MLDECKGERLEEVLAVFSTVVMKHLVLQNHAGYEAVAQRLAMENFSYTGERAGLLALVLAHKFSLQHTVSQKIQAKKQYNDFSDILKLKDRQITRRHEQLKVTVEEDENTEYITRAETFKLQEDVRKNWYGSTEWLESILHGDGRFETDNLLSQSYGNVWKNVERGRIGEIEDSQRKGLLEQLDARVREQKSRYEKWNDFEKAIRARRSGAGDEKVSIKPTPDLNLGFGAHETLQLPSNPLKSLKNWQPRPDQVELIDNLRKELANVGKPKHYERSPRRRVSIQQEEQSPTPSPEPALEPARELQPQVEENDSASNSESDDESVELEELSFQAPPSDRVQEEQRAPSPELEPLSEIEAIMEVVPQSPPPTASRSVSTYSTMPPPSPPTRSFGRPIIPPPSPTASRSVSTYSSMPPPSPPTTSSNHPIIPPPSPPSPDIALQILNSMAAASPSPTKPRHVLSLAERTRMSMSRNSTSRPSTSRNSVANVEDFDDLPDLPQLLANPKIRLRAPSLQSPTSPITPDTPADAESEAAAAKEQRHADLISRTRLSLSNSASVVKNAQLERRRSVKLAAKKKRESYMPQRGELEPTLEGEDAEVIDRVALMEAEPQDVDYEAVFKSRPRIKTSPASSPMKAWGEMGGDGDREWEGGSSSPVPFGL